MRHLFYLLLSILSVTTSFAESIRVVDKDTNKGVKCEIWIKKTNGELKLVSKTNRNGYIQVNFECSELEELEIRPEGDYYKKIIDCPLKMTKISVLRIEYVKNLLLYAEKKQSVGDYGSAALALNDVVDRIKEYNKTTADSISIEVYKATGKALNVANPTVFDPIQARTVISPELGRKIRNYQKDNSLSVTGKLDFYTLSSISQEALVFMIYSSPSEIK